MKRRIAGLHEQAHRDDDVPDGIYLVQIEQARYKHAQKPYCQLRFLILEPAPCRDRTVSGRLYCTPKALWKLNWFLQDFGYDEELLGQDELDERALVGLKGVLRLSQVAVNGRAYLNLDGFAPAPSWDETLPDKGTRRGAA
jgi:hypothetical protein